MIDMSDLATSAADALVLMMKTRPECFVPHEGSDNYFRLGCSGVSLLLSRPHGEEPSIALYVDRNDGPRQAFPIGGPVAWRVIAAFDKHVVGRHREVDAARRAADASAVVFALRGLAGL